MANSDGNLKSWLDRGWDCSSKDKQMHTPKIQTFFYLVTDVDEDERAVVNSTKDSFPNKKVQNETVRYII